MPVTRGAIKKLRQDKKREKSNLIVKKSVKKTLKDFRDHPNPKKLAEVFSILDNAKKKKIIHTNKVSRLKSGLSKLLVKPKSSK